MSLGLLIALILLIIVLLCLFGYRYNNGAYAAPGSVVGAICAVLLFLMAIGALHL